MPGQRCWIHLVVLFIHVGSVLCINDGFVSSRRLERSNGFTEDANLNI